MINKLLTKGILGLFIGIALLSFSIGTGPSPVAFAAPGDSVATPATPQNGGDSVTGKSDDVETDCAINKIGWILCPLIDISAKIGDQAFNFLAKSFLETEPELVSSQSGTRDAWELARNMANIMFIIVFLIIILSQVTGRGLDNYGIKKTLPRLIIAAVAVNASYYICQALVDITNIMGWEIKDFLIQLAQQVSDRTVFPPQESVDVQTGNGFLGSAAGLVLGAVALVWFFLPVLVLGVSVVVITCLVIVLVLLLRKAIIILLVVVSPIAFVLYLLPNTEKYFQRWLSMFWKLLMVFPVVAMLFGGGQLASAIVLTAGSSSSTDVYEIKTKDNRCIQLPKSGEPLSINNQAEVRTCGQGQGTPLLLGFVAAGIAVAPLLAVWAVLKGAIGAVGAIGGKVTGAIESYTGKAVKNKATDWAQKRARENIAGGWQRYQARSLEAKLDPNTRPNWRQRGAAGLAMRKADRDERLSLSKSGLERLKQRASNEEMKEGEGVLRGLGKNEQERALRAARAAEEGRVQEEIKAESIQAKTMDVYRQKDAAGNEIRGTGLADELTDGINNGTIDLDSAKTAAQIRRVFEAGSAEMKAGLIDAISHSGRSSLANRTVSESAQADNPGYWAPSDIDAINRGAVAQNRTAAMMAMDSIAGGRVGAEKLASMGKDEAEYLHKVSKGSAAAKSTLAGVVATLDASPDLLGKVRHNKDVVDKIRNGNWT